MKSVTLFWGLKQNHIKYQMKLSLYIRGVKWRCGGGITSNWLFTNVSLNQGKALLMFGLKNVKITAS